MAFVPYALTRPFLFGLDPETAHDLTLGAIAHLQNTPAQALWQQTVQPASAALSAVAAGVMGMLFFFARRRHAVEHAQLHATQEATHD